MDWLDEVRGHLRRKNELLFAKDSYYSYSKRL